MKNRIGIFGGTFDPVHNGHLFVTQSLLKSNLLDQIWVMPSPDPPHKTENNLSDFSHRYKMIELMFSDSSRIVVSDYESTLPRPSYTLNTLKALYQKHPDSEFYLCLGEDSIVHFHKWYRYKEILSEIVILVAERPGFDKHLVQPDVLEKVIFVEHNPVSISSTDIRDELAAGKNSIHIPQIVADYIHKNELYSK
jgi:nicotinate-nucleotide adenylyltransferase